MPKKLNGGDSNLIYEETFSKAKKKKNYIKHIAKNKRCNDVNTSFGLS